MVDEFRQPVDRRPSLHEMAHAVAQRVLPVDHRLHREDARTKSFAVASRILRAMIRIASIMARV